MSTSAAGPCMELSEKQVQGGSPHPLQDHWDKSQQHGRSSRRKWKQAIVQQDFHLTNIYLPCIAIIHLCEQNPSFKLLLKTESSLQVMSHYCR